MTRGTTMRVRIVSGGKISAPTTNSTALVVNSILNGGRNTIVAALVNAQIMNGTNRAMPNVPARICGVVLFMTGARTLHPQLLEKGITTDRNVPGFAAATS